MMEKHYSFTRLEGAIKPNFLFEIVSVVAVVTLSTIILKCVRVIYNWIRMYWHFRKLPRPKRVFQERWGMPEAIVCLYWMDTHLSPTARLFNFFKKSVATYLDEDLAVYYYGPQAIILVNTPMAMEAIVRCESNLTKPFVYGFMKTLMGTSLLTCHKGIWRSRRRTLNPAFSTRNVWSFVPVISRRSESLVLEILENKSVYCDSYFDVLGILTSTTCGVLLETVLGVRVDQLDVQEIGLMEALKGFCEGFMSRLVNALCWSDFLYELTAEGKYYRRCCDRLRDYSKEIISKRKEALKAKGAEKNYTGSFLDILLEMHLEDGSITEEQVLDEAVTIFAAGYDTTAALAAYCLYLLGNHRDVQVELHQEIDRIFGDDVRRPVTIDDLRSMKYLTCVIKETLRLYPSVPIMGRYIEEDMKIGTQFIPKGTMAMVLIYFLHRHPRFHKNPNSFTPERFSCDTTRPQQYAYMPFFGGPRNCIGQRFAVQEAMIVVAQLMRHFEIHSKLPEEELQLELGVVLRPSQGLEVKLTPRRPHNELENTD